MSETVLYETKNGVAIVTLNRPSSRNAFTPELAHDLHGAMLKAQDDEEARVVVLTGAGDCFCVGVDVNAILPSAGSKDPRVVSRNAWPLWPLDPAERYDYQGPHNYFPAIEKPILGMINGAVAGIGLVYALFCDICFASDRAIFSTAFVRRGVPAENGLAWLLPRLIGQAKAADLLLSGRKLDAAEALGLGLVAGVYPHESLRASTLVYAEEMATWCAPAALAATKRQLWEAPFQTLAESNMLFKSYLAICMKTEDYKEAAESFLQKRPPRFKGR